MTHSQDPSIIIKGIGSYAPEKVLTNDELSHMVDTSDEWIRARTGIRERHIARPDEATSDLGTEAAKAALANAGMRPDEIDLIIVATITPDMPFPSTACFVQTKLGLKNVPAFDITAACSGFLYALDVAAGMLRGGAYRNILVIGAEKLSSVTNWDDRTTCVLFGDGAGAVVLGISDTPGEGILDSLLGADGQDFAILHIPAGGSAKPTSMQTVQDGGHFIHMQGNQVFKIAVRAMEQSATTILERQGLTADQITWVIPHQANNRIIEAISQRLGIGMDRFWVNLDSFGNTSSASIPIALDEAYRAGSIKKGDNLLFVSFGAGLTWASTLIKWH
ncbi:MAG: beta-ketoacyl-ACP synthase III [Opitutales bacterium]|jgi:3-oxoacyl-[acyl-carrier-protein] synthase-3